MKQEITAITIETIVDFTKGDRKAFRVVYEYYYAGLYRFALSLVNNGEDAKDIAAEVFLKLWKLHQGFETETNIKAFLYISVRNACVNYLKAQKLHTEKHRAILNEFSEEDLDIITKKYSVEAEIIEKLYKEVENLPGQCKKICKMFLAGMKPQEIAEQLNIKTKTVYNQRDRAIELLKSGFIKDSLISLLLFLLLSNPEDKNISKKTYTSFGNPASFNCFYNNRPILNNHYLS